MCSCAYNICSHSIAIAERLALLADFLANFNRVNRCNLSRLTDIGQPKNAGEKATKATQCRKGAADQQKKGPRAYKSSGSASFSASAPAPTAALDQIQLLVTQPRLGSNQMHPQPCPFHLNLTRYLAHTSLHF